MALFGSLLKYAIQLTDYNSVRFFIRQIAGKQIEILKNEKEASFADRIVRPVALLLSDPRLSPTDRMVVPSLAGIIQISLKLLMAYNFPLTKTE